MQNNSVNSESLRRMTTYKISLHLRLGASYKFFLIVEAIVIEKGKGTSICSILFVVEGVLREGFEVEMLE
ncbi:hypothetical protein Scep_001753 [Stephania cephalantha]|uniref:Uncharacterized protein n=1 Tax=Stephania cephalantha TaxID=152367 RepID=A0AAP0LA13_9MAGN